MYEAINQRLDQLQITIVILSILSYLALSVGINSVSASVLHTILTSRWRCASWLVLPVHCMVIRYGGSRSGTNLGLGWAGIGLVRWSANQEVGSSSLAGTFRHFLLSRWSCHSAFVSTNSHSAIYMSE